MADLFLYPAIEYTGTGEDSLDSYNGNILKDKEAAVVVTLSKASFYHLDADAAGSESVPDKITPNANAGDKRWILVGITAKGAYFTDKVGIGTDSPTDLLHIKDASSNLWVYIETDKVDGLAAFWIVNDAQGWACGVDTNDSFKIGSGGMLDAELVIEPSGKPRLTLGSSTIVVNENGEAVSFRVETSGKAYAFFIDGETSDIYFGGTQLSNCRMVLDYSEDTLYIGRDDVANGNLILWGNPTGKSSGGTIYFYNSVDYDTTHEYYWIVANSGNLCIGSENNFDALILTESHDFKITDGDLSIKNPSGDIAYVYIGEEGSHRGIINVYGGDTGDSYGGTLIVKTADDYDDTVDYWQITAYQDQLRIGCSGQSDMLQIEYVADKWMWLKDADFYITNATDDVAKIYLGQAGNQRGELIVYGDNTGGPTGGYVICHTADDYDTTIESYYFAVYQDDLYIGPNTDSDALKLDNFGNFYVTDGHAYIVNVSNDLGALFVGTDDTIRGYIYLYGHAAGVNDGGRLMAYTSADYDTAIEFYHFRVYQDDLWIGSSADTDVLKLDSSKDLYLTDGDLTIRNPSDDLAAVTIGQGGSHRGMLIVHGENTGSANGGALLVYLADDYDTTITNYSFKAYEDDLYIGPNTNTDMLKLDAEGYLNFGTHTTLGAETVTGYITIKDEGGTVRKLAVVS